MKPVRRRFSALLVLFVAWAFLGWGNSFTAQAQGAVDTDSARFALDFDVLFDLKKPCDLTPAKLESKVATLAVIPDEKLCRPVKFPTEQCHYHWFGPRSSPRHNPILSIFKSQIHPEFLSVVWQGEEMERFYCTYLAEKDQALPPQLIADMDASLGASHAPSTRAVNGIEWNLEHYTVKAEYSTNVGKGEPRFLIKVWNKAYKTKPAVISGNSSPAKATTGVVEINLDEIIDWKNPLDMTKVAFQGIMKQYEKIPGKPVFSEVPQDGSERSFITLKSSTDYTVSMKAFGGAFALEGLWIDWKEGKADLISLGFTRDPGANAVSTPLMKAFESVFGTNHRVIQHADFDDYHVWDNINLVSAHCFSHRQINRIALTLRRLPPTAAAAATFAPRPSSTPTASLQGKVFQLDAFLNWKAPFEFRRDTLEEYFQPVVKDLGFTPWRHNDMMTMLGSNGGASVPMSLFEGKFKVNKAYIAWIDRGDYPQAVTFQFDPVLTTQADEEWLYAQIDSILRVPRSRLTVNDLEKGYFWHGSTCDVRVTKKAGEYVDMKIIRTGGFDPSGPKEVLSANLDALLNFTSLWSWSTEDFEKNYAPKAAKQEDQKKPPQFEWLSTDKARARFSRQMFSNVETKLSMFAGSIKVEEAVVEFVNGKAARSTISFYNRGDSGDITVADFERIFKTIGQGLGQVLKVAPKRQLNSANAALPVTGWMWTSPQAIALLEYNEYNTPGRVTKPEFLRLKLAAPSQADFTMGKMVTGVQSMELAKRVTKGTEGDIYITGVPMVDQGAKGYCVAASCQRLFEYLRIPCDQHEMAQLVNVDAESGANIFAMQKSLAKIDERFKVSFKPLVNPTLYYSNNGKRRVSEKEFTSLVKEYANKGIPLLWALELGKAAEIPPLPGSGQTRGGHMRMIIGYNDAKKQVIFTDSWGAGHELKRMALLDAYDVTIGLFSMAPRGL